MLPRTEKYRLFGLEQDLGYEPFIETEIGDFSYISVIEQIYLKWFEDATPYDDHPYKDEIIDFLYKVYTERYYASIVHVLHDNERNQYKPEYTAQLAFFNAVVDSSNRFAPMIQALTADKVALIAAAKHRKRIERSKDEAVEKVDDAFSDTSLRKENNTPGAGANPNLIEDTYLSFSERTRVDGDERKSVTNTVAAPSDNYETEVSEVDAEAINKLDEAVADIYGRWLRFIDKGWLVV